MSIVIRKKSLLYGALLSLCYAFLTMLISTQYIVSECLLSISLFLLLVFVYDTSHGFATSCNIFCIVFYGVGVYGRFIYVLLFPNELMSFAPSPIAVSADYMTNCALTILLSVIAFGIGKALTSKDGKCAEKEYVEVEHLKTWLNQRRCVGFIYLLISGISMGYEFSHIVLATENMFNNLDTLMSLFNKCQMILAIMYLSSYVYTKKKLHLVFYLIYLVPTCILSLVSGWKGTIPFQLVFLMMTIYLCGKKIKPSFIVALFASIVVLYPVITMIRSGVTIGSGGISFSGMRAYYASHSLIENLSKRFAYFDEIYYVRNMNSSIIATYNEQAGHIVTRFFAGLIPRAIWANKPIMNSGSYVTYTLLGYNPAIYNNLTISLIGDAYVDMGAVGVFAYMLMFGIYIQSIEKLTKAGDILKNGLYIALAYNAFQYMEGDIASKTLSVLLYLIVFFALKITLFRKRTCR